VQSRVYVQVQHLFKGAPDLLDKFKDFLPDAVSSGSGPSWPPILLHDRQDNPENRPPSVRTGPLEALYPMPPDGGGGPIADYAPGSVSFPSHLDLAKHPENSFYFRR
jgi:histone deacetylase complex regulatory component SIN3